MCLIDSHSNCGAEEQSIERLNENHQKQIKETNEPQNNRNIIDDLQKYHFFVVDWIFVCLLASLSFSYNYK